MSLPAHCVRHGMICLLAVLLCGCGGSTLPDSFVDDLKSTPYLTAKSEAPADMADVFGDTQLGNLDEIDDLPNPGRTNPFQQSEQTAAPRQINRPQLKGFVERGEARVVLVLGERIGVVGVNEQFEDVTVLEIRPPQVVFRQRGVEHRLSL